MKKLLLVLVLMAPACVFAQPPSPPPKPPPIRLPVVVQPIPTPTPVPVGTPIALNKANTYVFDADVPCIVKASPPGLVSITQESGPFKFKARFADDPAKVQCRKFDGKFVYTIDALKSGNVTLLVIPTGLQSDSDIQSASLAVDAGDLPGPGPGPSPPPPDDSLAAAVKAAYVSEPAGSKAVDAPRLAFLYDDMIRSTVADPQVKTWGDFVKILIAQRKQMIGDRMPAVRKVIDGLFAAKFPNQPGATFDDAARQLAKTVLTDAASALKGVQ